jgi:hypothetical protein
MLIFVAILLASAQPHEYEVKAAFLLNFTKFVDWPADAFSDPDGRITICILGKDPFGASLDDLLREESVNGHKLAVRRIAATPSAHSCQIVFLEAAQTETVNMLAGMGPGVLTVGEGERFLRRGGMIAFVVDKRRVRFDIDQRALENAGLKVSSKLLSVARAVRK